MGFSVESLCSSIVLRRRKVARPDVWVYLLTIGPSLLLGTRVTSTHLVPTVPGVQLEVLSVVSPETRDPTLQLGPGVGTLMILATVTVDQGTAYISICVTQRLSVNLM